VVSAAGAWRPGCLTVAAPGLCHHRNNLLVRFVNFGALVGRPEHFRAKDDVALIQGCRVALLVLMSNAMEDGDGRSE
jgi:hypothetical protein